jgi:hypothetical protein
VALLVAAVAVGLVAAGCSYLYPYGYGPFGVAGDPFASDGPFASGDPFASWDPFASEGPFWPSQDPFADGTTFHSGRATLTIDGKEIVLDRLSDGPHVVDQLGATVYWYNDDGWGLQMFGGGTDLVPAAIELMRFRNAFWMTGNADTGCTVTVDEADAGGVHGSATCTGLRWTDVLRQGYAQSPIPDEPPFDVRITFDAGPDAGT